MGDSQGWSTLVAKFAVENQDRWQGILKRFTTSRRLRKTVAVGIDTSPLLQQELLNSGIAVYIQSSVDMTAFVLVTKTAVNNVVSTDMTGVSSFDQVADLNEDYVSTMFLEASVSNRKGTLLTVSLVTRTNPSSFTL